MTAKEPKLKLVSDSLTNVLAGLQVGKSRGTSYSDVASSPAELKAAYDTAWLPAKIVDLPAEDAVREWRRWANNPKAARMEERRIHLRVAVRDALVTARLYGGSAIYIDTGSRTPENPISDSEHIERLVQLGPTDITWPDKPDNPFTPPSHVFKIGEREVDASRIAIFQGVRPVSGQYGFGRSVLDRAMEAIKNADSVPAAVSELVWEAKVDVFKIQNFMSQLGSPGYEQKIIKRLQLAERGKSLTHALLMDKEEDYEQKQIRFAELSALMLTVYQVAAGAANIPMTRLIGRSAAGLNSAGDNEVRDYYDRVRVAQELDIAPAIFTIDQAIGRATSQPVDYKWRPLWQLSPSEASTVLMNESKALVGRVSSGLIPNEVLYEPAIALMDAVMPGLSAASEQHEDNE